MEPAAAVPPPLPTVPPPISYRTPAPLPVPDNWSNVEIFVLRPDALSRFIGVIVLIHALLAVVIIAAMILVLWLFLADTLAHALFGGAIFAFIMLIYTVVTVTRDILKTRKEWVMTRVAIADQGVVNVGLKPPAHVAERSQIRHIVDAYDVFKLVLHDGRHLSVPKRLENVEQVRQRLAALAPFAERAQGIGSAIALTMGVCLSVSGAVGGFWIGMATNDIQIAIICLVVVLAGVSYMARLIWLSLTLQNQKWMAVVSYVAPLLLLLRTVWLMLSGR